MVGGGGQQQRQPQLHSVAIARPGGVQHQHRAPPPLQLLLPVLPEGQLAALWAQGLEAGVQAAPALAEPAGLQFACRKGRQHALAAVASQPAGGLIEGCVAGAFEGLAQQQRPPALIEAEGLEVVEAVGPFPRP